MKSRGAERPQRRLCRRAVVPALDERFERTRNVQSVVVGRAAVGATRAASSVPRLRSHAPPPGGAVHGPAAPRPGASRSLPPRPSLPLGEPAERAPRDQTVRRAAAANRPSIGSPEDAAGPLRAAVRASASRRAASPAAATTPPRRRGPGARRGRRRPVAELLEASSNRASSCLSGLGGAVALRARDAIASSAASASALRARSPSRRTSRFTTPRPGEGGRLGLRPVSKPVPLPVPKPVPKPVPMR